MKESSEINLPRYGRVLGAANAAARQMPGALVRCAENSEAFVNTVRLTVPPDAELNKIAVHYLHNAAFAADKTTLRTGTDGVSILFAVDMTQPSLDGPALLSQLCAGKGLPCLPFPARWCKI